MRVLSIETMNRCVQNNISEYVSNSEGHYLRQIEKTAQVIANSATDKPIILLSGPSGSGKTTTAFRIRDKLCELGFKTYALSMDNYFLTIDDPRNEREEDGKIDFESPKRLDKDLLSEHLEMLFCGTEFTLPVFDFANQKSLLGKRFQRKENELVIIEGIHALNPEVTGRVEQHASGVYVSVRTRLKSKNGKLLHPSKIRLMRRLVRDKLFRARKAEQTLEFFANVQRGEKKFILPYKGRAEHHIDTLIAYETQVYKRFLTEELGGVAGFSDAEEIFRFLAELENVDEEHIPGHSLVREFVGGSSFEY
ncbi:MAG: nucleoside kinase [Oscillospiraceae bacterium]|nr:nucleoside kinase [Oscillospiraceae bacterium]